ncbi:sigma-E processing peptidase SpoIIGA [Paenibacillus flagellatus]|uniref:Sporulation sigma-E factor-processing peptidase n=1 Tax=Paenibacillus flagellatus TaxID=2211139 RepID=A0A2V5K5C5_9BACL|nr:sigma-E processing peptidase SpoIIGA [Paenibacillus flagellatus]PYI54569.1 sigma-E processing peptidase SpoIIGA [Paenibacillus flagellatus]
MIVYPDLIFLTNLLIDGAILAVTARIRHIRPRFWRLGASAMLGASYVVMMLVPSLSFMFTLVAKCLFSAAMIWIAFGFGGLQTFLRNAGTFYVVSFAAAGGMFGLHYLLQSPGDVMNGILVTRSGGLAYRIHIGALFVAFTLVPLLWLFRTVFVSAKRKRDMTHYLAEVRIRIDEHESVCTGLIDTGNQLYDPLTRTPVMVVEATQWGEVLPEAWMRRIRQSEVDQLVAAIGTDDSFVWQDRLRLIPYRGVNRGTQFMLALKPDKVVIVHNETEIVNVKVLVGLDGGKLCADGSYQAIIHPNLVQMEA